mgnify:CR=1 FL=1
MRPLAYLLSALAVMALAFWAYHSNYATQQALKDVSKLNREIAALRDALSIQRAEWAYLNRPDRLRELATINFDTLGLLALQSEQFGQAACCFGFRYAGLAGDLTQSAVLTQRVLNLFRRYGQVFTGANP